MSRTHFSLIDDPPSAASRRQANQSGWRRRTWQIWGAAALLWFVGSTAYYGFGVGDQFAVSTRPPPLLSGTACHSVLGVDGKQSCEGVVSMSRDRRIMLRDRASDHAIEAGSVILGPPVFSLLGVLMLMHYTRPQSSVLKRAHAGHGRG